VTEGAEALLVDPDVLLAAVEALVNAVKVELGEKASKKPPAERRAAPLPKPPTLPRTESPPVDEDVDPIRRCLAAMLLMRIADQNDGSLRLFAAACRAVEHDLSDTDALSTIRAYERERPFLSSWSDNQVMDRVRDAERQCTRGAALTSEHGGMVPLGQRDPETGRLVLSPKRTLPTAEAFIREFHAHPDGRTLHSYAGALFVWCDNRFAEVEDGAVRQRVLPWLHDALRYVYNRRTESVELADFESNPSTVSATVESLRAYTHLPVVVTPPTWLRDDPSLPPPRELLACRSLTLHVPTGRLLPPTPNLFNISALEFDYDPHPEPCERWALPVHTTASTAATCLSCLSCSAERSLSRASAAAVPFGWTLASRVTPVPSWASATTVPRRPRPSTPAPRNRTAATPRSNLLGLKFRNPAPLGCSASPSLDFCVGASFSSER
jgi:hypothetical protein